MQSVSAGEEIVTTKHGKPVAKLAAMGPKAGIDRPDFFGEAIESRGGKSASDTVIEGREERL